MAVAETISDVLTEYIDTCGHYCSDEIGNDVPGFIQLGYEFIRLKYTCTDCGLFTGTKLGQANRCRIEKRVQALLSEMPGVNHIRLTSIVYVPDGEDVYTAYILFKIGQ